MWNYIQGVKNPAENVERKAELKEYFNDYERKRARKISLKWTDNRPWLVSTTNGMTCTWCSKHGTNIENNIEYRKHETKFYHWLQIV